MYSFPPRCRRKLRARQKRFWSAIGATPVAEEDAMRSGGSRDRTLDSRAHYSELVPRDEAGCDGNFQTCFQGNSNARMVSIIFRQWYVWFCLVRLESARFGMVRLCSAGMFGFDRVGYIFGCVGLSSVLFPPIPFAFGAEAMTLRCMTETIKRFPLSLLFFSLDFVLQKGFKRVGHKS